MDTVAVRVAHRINLPVGVFGVTLALLGLALLGAALFGVGEDGRAAVDADPPVAPETLTVEEGIRMGVEAEAGGDARAAKEAYEAVLASDPRNVEALHRRAVLLRAEGETQQAIRSLERAVAVDSAFVPARLLMAELYAAEGRLDDALAQYQAVIDLAPPGVDIPALERFMAELE